MKKKDWQRETSPPLGRSLYSLVVRFGKPVELMGSKPDRMIDKADGKSTRPLRFGIAGQNLDSHGRFPLVKVDVLVYHGFHLPPGNETAQ